MDIVKRLNKTRANLLGTEDENLFFNAHEAAEEIENLRVRIDHLEAVIQSHHIPVKTFTGGWAQRPARTPG